MKKAIVIGASTGIGRALSKVLGANGYEVGLVSRKVDLLESLQQEIPTKTYVRKIDLQDPEEAIAILERLFVDMGEVDLIVVNSGVISARKELEWNQEKSVLDINVAGFTAMAITAFNYFSNRGTGHLVGISSISGLRGNPLFPTYAASKAYVSNYLQGLRYRAFKTKKAIIVTDIIPGFVETDLIKGAAAFWVQDVNTAARQIFDAIDKKKSQAYITKRWRLIAWLQKFTPDWVYMRSSS